MNTNNKANNANDANNAANYTPSFGEPPIVTRIITAVIPAYGSIDIVKNSVTSLATQWIPDDTFDLEIIIVDDNPEMDYTYFMSLEFQMIKNRNVSIGIIKNEVNQGQGVCRQIGIDNAHSNWVLLCDEDDMYAPNAIYRFWEILNSEYCGGNDGMPVALLAAPVYGFDENRSREIINSQAIWVNGKMYNRQFLRDNNIYFVGGKNSYRAEDYLFIEKLNYAISHNKYYKRVDFTDDADTFYYWIPNRNSQSRNNEFYTAKLTPDTMCASLQVYGYYKAFNEAHHIEQEEEEFMKHKILGMACYAYYAYVKWLHDMSLGWKDDPLCVESDWELYKEVMEEFRKELSVYWREILPSDIVDLKYAMKHNSDIKYVETFLPPFEEWIENGLDTLKMSFKDIKKYCSKLKFDGADHEMNAPYVKAWVERHS